MKLELESVLTLIFTLSASFAGSCPKYNHNNLESMLCQVGYTWDDEAKECIQAPQA